VEARKRKEDEAILFRKDTRKTAEEPKETKPAPVETKEEVQAAPAPVPAPAPAPIPEPEIPAPVAETPKVEKPAEPAHVKIEAPEVEAPVVLDKIDLSAIDSSTRPKKSSKKTEVKPAVSKEEKPKAKGKKSAEAQPKPVEEIKPVIEVAAKADEISDDIKQQEESGPVISNIKADKLEGPKILGKIELPVQLKTGQQQTTRKDNVNVYLSRERTLRFSVPRSSKEETTSNQEASSNVRTSDSSRPEARVAVSEETSGHRAVMRRARGIITPRTAQEEDKDLRSYHVNRKKSIKKKFRTRSVKRRRSLQVPEEGARALKQNTVVRNVMKLQSMQEVKKRRTISSSLQNSSA
jgi:hypothetical protein